MGYEFPCLYCGDTERQRTTEHVLQKGFNAEMTLPTDVCTFCNTAVFSPLDGDLIHYVRTIAYCDHPDVRSSQSLLQDGHPLVLQNGAWISVRVEGNARWVILPQVIFLGGGRLQLSVDTSAGEAKSRALLANMQKELAQPWTLGPLKRTILENLPKSSASLQPALIRSAPRKYCIRAESREAADHVAADVATGRLLAQLGTLCAGDDRTYERPGVIATFSFNLGNVERAIAKVALNFVCKVAGPEVARRRAFDDIRAFAREPIRDGKNPFVSQFDPRAPEVGGFFSNFGIEGYHSLALLGVGDLPSVFLALYGRPFALVRLTSQPSPDVLPRNPAVVVLFNYRQKTCETFSAGENFRSFWARFFGPGPASGT